MSELAKALNKLWRFDKNVLHNKKSKEELLANVYEATGQMYLYVCNI